jgi:hypothetical protein
MIAKPDIGVSLLVVGLGVAGAIASLPYKRATPRQSLSIAG